MASQLPARERVPFPLHTKLGTIVVAMTILAFLIYVPVAYNEAQVILGRRLEERASFALKQFVERGASVTKDPSFFAQARPFAVGRHGYLIAIDEKGAIFTAHPRGFTSLSQEDLEPEIYSALLGGEEGRFTSPRGGTRYIASIPAGHWRFLSFVYESDFLDELRPVLLSSVFVGLEFGVIFSVLIFFLVRGIAGPVSTLAHAAREVARHRRPFPVSVATGDEVEILADEFSEMARQLRDYEESLEKKIAQRTAELAETNEELKEKSMVLERVLEEVKKVDEELARLNRAKSEFISMASHQLRTPLTAIKWYAKILARGGLNKLSKTQQRALHQIVASNEHMIDLVNGLLNVSRVEMGTLAIEPERILIGKVIQQATQEVRPLAQERGVHLTIGPYPKARVILDPKLFAMIAGNLLSNAIRYTPKGGRVTVGLEVKGNRVILTVRDTGYGIPARQQKLVFSKFFRGTNIAEKEPQGTGLGLYLTKSIVLMMHGSINFTSKEGKGTTFAVSLPASGVWRREGSKGLIPMS